jgi:dolichol-phosphate mannosyltransferase
LRALAYGPVPGPVWLILPTYDEAATLAAVVAAARAALAGEDLHLLVVDDASPDGTGALAERLGAEVLHRPAKLGLGSAYVAGFTRALAESAELVCQLDADGSHDPAALPGMLALARTEADLVLGSRYVPAGGITGWSALRRAVSRGGCAYARTVLRVPVRDLTGGMKVWRADALRAIELATVRSQGYAFQVELTYRALRRGLRVAETPIVFRERGAGASKMTPRIALEAAWVVPGLRSSSRPRLPI